MSESKDSDDSRNERIALLEKELSRLREENLEIRRSEERYRRLFETVPVALQVTDKNGLITDVNPSHLAHPGREHTERSDYIGHCIFTRESIVRAGLSGKYARVLEGIPFEELGVHYPSVSGGGEARFNVRGVPLRDEKGIIGAIYIAEDVTELKHAQEELTAHEERLEQLVSARTTELSETNRQLRQEILEREMAQRERERLIKELQDASKKVKTLRGFLPICACCKKIRDDKGYWNQVETYLLEHSEIEFSHGLCPECQKRMYPDYCDESG
jgi:PAS domain S-box-containing protein